MDPLETPIKDPPPPHVPLPGGIEGTEEFIHLFLYRGHHGQRGKR
jgi:hypothetical protein